ncbi:MAG TPA: DNRLRE domain-containing protein [Candidatus Angelobacter sp.]|nr:DNRLRE domain-containing protein [Candidatus Angelobacter sp.]
MRTVAGFSFVSKSNTTSKFSISLAHAVSITFVLLLASSAFAQTTVTLQNGLNRYAGTTDDWILYSSGANLNQGTNNDLDIRNTNTDRTVIRFAIFASEGGPVPNGVTITSATLSLYKYNGPDAVIQATRLLRSWTETGVTWNTTGTGTAWTVPGAGGVGTDVVSSADGQGSIADAAVNNCTSSTMPAACWLNIDVTSGVQAFSSGTANDGWLLTQVSSSAIDQYKDFNSKDITNFPTARPKLTITYQSVPPPGACVNSPLPASGVAIATFNSMSLYYNPANAPSGNQIFVRYRLASADPSAPGFVWNQGHPLWYDTRNNSSGQPLNPYRGRGSVVNLEPNTQYVFEVGTGANYASATWLNHISDGASDCPSTWSESFPAGTTLTPWTGTNSTTTSSSYQGARSGSSRQQVLLANQSGTASGYTVYDFTGANAVAQTSNTSNSFPVVISGSYIVLKGLKVVGGESGIFIDPGSHDIVIDGVEITGYGRDCNVALGAGLTGDRACNEDSGIKFPDQSYGPVLNTKRVIIQHSKIHNPAFGANPWDGGQHPSGTAPIMMYPTGGQIVIRYNETYSTTNGVLGGPPDLNHYHEDGLVMGGCNSIGSGCDQQGIGPDVDIYKNAVMNYFDDGLETDGDGTNNRVWKNYFDYGGASAISTTPTYVGPVYVWRNVYNRQRECLDDPWGAETCNGGGRDSMMKSGGVGSYDGGRRYLYHNTSLQPPASSESSATGPNPLGAGTGVEDTGSSTPLENTVSRNNVFEVWKSNWGAFTFNSTASGNDLDYDLTNGVMSETNGFAATTPQYQSGNGWSSYWTGKYRLVPGTHGYDDGVIIPNFNDSFFGAGPDRGAHEDGTPDMDFGTGASGH